MIFRRNFREQRSVEGVSPLLHFFQLCLVALVAFAIRPDLAAGNPTASAGKTSLWGEPTGQLALSVGVSILSSFADSKGEHYLAAGVNAALSGWQFQKCYASKFTQWQFCLMGAMSALQAKSHYDSGKDLGRKRNKLAPPEAPLFQDAAYYEATSEKSGPSVRSTGCDLFAVDCKHPSGSAPKFRVIVKKAGLPTLDQKTLDDLKKRGVTIDFDKKTIKTPTGVVSAEAIQKRLDSLKKTKVTATEVASTGDAFTDAALTPQSLKEMSDFFKSSKGEIAKATNKMRQLIQEDKDRNMPDMIAAYEKKYLKSQTPSSSGTNKRSSATRKGTLGSAIPSGYSREVASQKGLVKTLAGGVIVGVQGDSIFQMIRRKYEEKRKQKIFRERFGIYQY